MSIENLQEPKDIRQLIEEIFVGRRFFIGQMEFIELTDTHEIRAIGDIACGPLLDKSKQYPFSTSRSLLDVVPLLSGHLS